MILQAASHSDYALFFYSQDLCIVIPECPYRESRIKVMSLALVAVKNKKQTATKGAKQ
jgi:hypothetical protein|tara:strand:+ start:210 stop:383 length:174 start_codon:yes stop_codon:yes gene_type:complete